MKRFRKSSFSVGVSNKGNVIKLTKFLQSDPLAEEFALPPYEKPKDIVGYLIHRQHTVFGTSIIERFNYKTLIKHIKTLLKKYTREEVLRGIEYSVLIGHYPGSIKFIEECIHVYRNTHI